MHALHWEWRGRARRSRAGRDLDWLAARPPPRCPRRAHAFWLALSSCKLLERRASCTRGAGTRVGVRSVAALAGGSKGADARRRPSSPRCGRDAPTVVVHHYARRRRRAKKENMTRPRKKCAAALFSGWSVGNPLSLPLARHARTPMAGRPRPRRRPCLPALLCLLSAMGRAASGSRMFTCHAAPTYTYTQPTL